MDFEYYYDKLPGFFKYNRHILNFFLNLSKIIKNRTNTQLDSQSELLSLIFTSSDIKITGTLRDMQLLYVELLKFIDGVCSKYDIDYWIDYGTLLGAVRHGGFIPWDDDIDLSIMRSDYEKLIEVLPVEINKFPMLKENVGLTLLLENGKNHFKDFNGVHDVINDDDLVRKDKFNFLQIAWLKPYCKIDFIPKDYIKENELENFSKNYVSVKYKFNKDVLKGKVNFYEEFDKRKKKLGMTNEKTKYFVNSLDCPQLSDGEIYKTDDAFPLTKIKFEGFEFNCPKDYDSHLKSRFGDNYMEIPKIIEYHNIVPFIKTQFKSKKEMDDSFNEAVKILSEVTGKL